MKFQRYWFINQKPKRVSSGWVANWTSQHLKAGRIENGRAAQTVCEVS